MMDRFGAAGPKQTGKLHHPASRESPSAAVDAPEPHHSHSFLHLLRTAGFKQPEVSVTPDIFLSSDVLQEHSAALLKMLF